MNEVIVELVKAVLSAAIPAAVGYMLAWIRAKQIDQRKADSEYKAIKDGMQAILRDRLIYYHGHYTEKGYAPIFARENFVHMYESYKELGGNGVIEDIHKQFMELPTDKQNEVA